VTRRPATERQLQAARPERSTWLTANAGSGKTRVLTERVARLLLTGVEPQRILCLTYTKAAASEMQNRLFGTLGQWAMMPERQLRAALKEVGEAEDLNARDLARARTLFARAIETPGGLKIQTIHAFCAAVLRRFPLEAGVSPDFKEMDDRLAKLMQREVIEDLAASGDTGFAALAAHHTSDDLTGLLYEVIGKTQALLGPKSRDELWRFFSLESGYDFSKLCEDALRAGDQELIETVARALAASSPKDARVAARLSSISVSPPTPAALAALEDLLVYNEKAKAPLTAKTDGVPTKAGRALLGEVTLAAFHDLMARMEAALPRRRALIAAERSWALYQFSESFLPAYEARKAQGGWLDFDDLIERTRTLLTQSSMAPWVLFKLDGGIDHVLVDEAQDTSPSQWDVVRILCAEFLAGEGARSNVGRSVFVVGDKKQSIYSFQGADPRAFDDTKAHFEKMLKDAPMALQDLSLDYSFRSSPAILDVVDGAFKASNHRGLGQESHHLAFKSRLPGRVDILDVFEPVSPEKPVWHEAVDRISDVDHRRLLAEAVAKQIKEMIGTAQIPRIDRDVRTDRPVEPRDILILVQRRSPIFSEIIRACKTAGIPMAGADQLNVAQELAVQDITALLSFLATPEDDLALACALKSPLFDWTEEALFDLAHHREGAYLWQELRRRGHEFPKTLAILQDMLSKADFLRPFELIDRALTLHEGRRRIVARLGPEAEDAIDALLAQALTYESAEVPSLTGFLIWLAADDLKIKRAIDTSANVVRVMTVHGAKGLEAPIVIMPDTAHRATPRSPALALLNETAIWLPAARERTSPITALMEERRMQAEDERQRLLYVALTRAECWLIVAAAGKTQDSWYEQIESALTQLPLEQIEGGRRYQPLGWPEDAVGAGRQEDSEDRPLDLSDPPKPELLSPVIPSDLGGAKTLHGSDEDAVALMRGTVLHKLLDRPQDRWDQIAIPDDLDGTALREEARAVLEAEHLRFLFAPDTLSEVPLTARIDAFGSRPLRGTIDRLVIRDDHVLAVDFKSNRLEPASQDAVPSGLLRQMGAYAAALALIYPNKRVDTALVWTKSATLMPLSHMAVMAALQSAAPA